MDIRWSSDCLISAKTFPKLITQRPYIETDPGISIYISASKFLSYDFVEIIDKAYSTFMDL